MMYVSANNSNVDLQGAQVHSNVERIARKTRDVPMWKNMMLYESEHE